MNAEALLDRLQGVSGVEAAALVDAEGETVRAVGVPGRIWPGLVTSVLASAKALSGLLGGERFEESLIQYERGPVIVTPLPGAAGPGYVAVLALAADAKPGRVRHQLRGIVERLKGS